MTMDRKAAEGIVVKMGVPASGGLASGPAHLVLPRTETVVEDRELDVVQVRTEVRRFRLAIRRSLDEIQALQECLLGDADDPGLKILDVHRMLLDDLDFQNRVIHGIRRERRPAAVLMSGVFSEMISTLEAAGSEYFRARTADIHDVRRRILRHLEGGEPAHGPVPVGSIVVAPELSPSETTSFDPDSVKALVTDHGGPTSHAAILARSRGIPAVVGLGDLASQVREGDEVLVDGFRGLVVVRPGPEQVGDFERRRKAAQKRARQMARHASGPAVTQDGHPVVLQANIEVPEDLEKVLKVGAQGIGLYRTEFFYLNRRSFPDEEGQYRAYRRIAQKMRPRPVTIRTLDAGGDKFANYIGTSRESNPFLGLRGIRFSLGHPDIFRTQIRAILRASAHGTVRILFPMVSSLEEVRQANQMVDEACQELRREGKAMAERIDRGIMIEVPAAVSLSDLLAREVDFFSIGSNDLIQYTLAVDRENEKIAHLYSPYHPAVVRSLAYAIDAANRARIPISSCGEMSGSAHGAAVLIGLGCTSLSMSPFQMQEVRELVRRMHLVDLRRLAEEILLKGTVEEVTEVLRAFLGPSPGNGLPGNGTPAGVSSRSQGTGE